MFLSIFQIDLFGSVEVNSNIVLELSLMTQSSKLSWIKCLFFAVSGVPPPRSECRSQAWSESLPCHRPASLGYHMYVLRSLVSGKNWLANAINPAAYFPVSNLPLTTALPTKATDFSVRFSVTVVICFSSANMAYWIY